MAERIHPGPECSRRYALKRRLGAGAMGEVHLAEDRRLGRLVALKFLLDQALTPSLRSRFFEEARAMGDLRHPHVVEVLDCGDIEVQPYIAMEFVEGESLRARLQREGCPSLEQALTWMDELCEAVAFAHSKGILHRDLKPANILLDGDGRVKVADFGLAKRGDRREELTRTGLILGTPSYLAPECVTGSPAGVSSDLYAMATLLFELLTGRLPFEGDSVMEVLRARCGHAPPDPRNYLPHLSPPLSLLVLKGLAKDPAERFPDVDSFRLALSRIRGAGADAEAASTQILARGDLPRAEHRSSERHGRSERETLRPEGAPLEAFGEARLGRSRQARPWPVLLCLGLLLSVAGGVAWRRSAGGGKIPAPALQIEVDWNGAAVRWTSREAERWSWSVHRGSGRGAFTQGRETEASRDHRLSLRALVPDSVYVLRLELEGHRFERSFRTLRPELQGEVLALASEGSFWIDYHLHPPAPVTLVVEPVGTAAYRRVERRVSPTGPAKVDFKGLGEGLRGFLWTLRFEERILARGLTNSRITSFDLHSLPKGSRVVLSLSHGPVWFGRDLLCADEGGTLTCLGLGDRGSPCEVGRALPAPVLKLRWQMGGAAGRRDGIVAAQTSTRALWVLGGNDRNPGLVRCVDLEARARAWPRLAGSPAWEGALGDAEWIVPGVIPGTLRGWPFLHGRTLYFAFDHVQKWMAAFDTERRKLLWTRRMPLEQDITNAHRLDVASPILATGGRLYWLMRREIEAKPRRLYRMYLLSCSEGASQRNDEIRLLDEFSTQARLTRIELGSDSLWYCSMNRLRRFRLDPSSRPRVEDLILPRSRGGFLGDGGGEISLVTGPCIRRGDSTWFFAFESLIGREDMHPLLADRSIGRLCRWEAGRPLVQDPLVRCEEDTADKAPYLVELFRQGDRLLGVTRSWIFLRDLKREEGGKLFLSLGGIRYASPGPDGLLLAASPKRLWIVPLDLIPRRLRNE